MARSRPGAGGPTLRGMSEPIEPLRFEDGALLVLDQRALPGEERWIRCRSPEQVADCIRTLAVRGAPAIGIAAAYAMALAAARGHDLEEAARALRATRPTAVNLGWALDRALELKSGGGAALLELVRSQLVEGLPLDAERRAEVRVWFAFLGLALTRPRLAQAGREAYRVWRGRIAKTLAAGQRDSLIDDSLDCEREAAELVALVDGLAIQASFEPRAATKDRQLELLDDRLAALRAPAATHGSRNR